MQLIKINDAYRETVYINVDEISYAFYDKTKDVTFIILKDKQNFCVKTNMLKNLVKLITTTTNSNLLHLE